MADAQSNESRYTASVERVYENEAIEIRWEPGLCIHFAACLRGSRQAFQPDRRPWVDVDAEKPERLAEIIAGCPTGALHARWKDGKPSEEAALPGEIIPTRNGPLFLRGHTRVLDRDGKLVSEDVRIALCRCGHSQNKPFCDDSHYRVGFVSDDPYLGGG